MSPPFTVVDPWVDNDAFQVGHNQSLMELGTAGALLP
jgi:hypothetical protein